MKQSCLQIVIIALLNIFVLLPQSYAQMQQDDSSRRYANSFYKFMDSDTNEDSALFYYWKVSRYKPSLAMLPTIIHEEFAQQTLNRTFPADTDSSKIIRFAKIQSFSKRLMAIIMADTNKIAKDIVNPLYLFSSIQDHISDNVKLAELTSRFIEEELSDSDIYSNRSGRYALMIYPIVNSKSELKPLAQGLLDKVSMLLENGQVNISEKSTRDDLTKRAWYRYLHAYSNIIRAEIENDSDKRKSYLKLAYDYSPDATDRTNNWGYFYEMFMIFGKEKGSFRDEYLQFLTDHAIDENTIFNTILEIALQQPEYKEKLKEAFYKVKGPQKDFFEFWMTSVNNYAETAPAISLSMLDKSQFSNKTVSGKWLVLDFWGTWCAPCRKEHPDLQKFYESAIKNNAHKIALLTIACRDTEARVTNYMAEKKLSFPVAMSDNKIEKTYKVPGYPTKLLITPAGKYVVVPSGSDWISFVKHYADL